MDMARDLEGALEAQGRSERTRRAVQAVLALRRDHDLAERVAAVAERCGRLYGETPREALATARVVVWGHSSAGEDGSLALETLAARPANAEVRERLSKLQGNQERRA
jgi:hypothetical protein